MSTTLLLTCWRFHLRVNFTGSMPYGIYREEDVFTISRGDIVAVCLNAQLTRYALEQRYIPNGDCPNGSQPLVKQVIALPSDNVSFLNSFVSVNGKSFYSPQLQFDHLHRPLTIFSSQQFSRGYWLRGYRDPTHSWDSRYFGVVSREDIRSVYSPVLIF